MLFVSFCRQLFLFSLLLISACTDQSDALTKTDQTNRLRTSTVALNTDSLEVVGAPQELIGRPINSKVSKPPVYVPQGIPETAPAHANVRPAGQPAVIPIPNALTSAVPGRGKMKNPESFEVETKQLAIEQPGAELALPPRIEYTATHDLQYLDVDQGILSSYIRSLLEDSKGYLWIATSFGVSRYDGNSFLHYTTSKGLPKDMGLCIMEDRQKNLWVCTTRGVSQCKPYTDEHGQVRYTVTGFLSDTDVRAVLEDPAGRLWFGTVGDGVYIFDPTSERQDLLQINTRHGLSSNTIWSLLEDQQGNIWMSTELGITMAQLLPQETPLFVDAVSGDLSGVRFFTFYKEQGLRKLDFQTNSACLDLSITPVRKDKA